MYWQSHGDKHIEFPDTGSYEPSLISFRKNNITINVDKIVRLNGSGGYIELWPKEGIYTEEQEFSIDCIYEGLMWYRREYKWYGIEIEKGIKKIVELLDPIRRLKWYDNFIKESLYEKKLLIRKNKKEIELNLTSDISNIISSLKFGDSITYNGSSNWQYFWKNNNGKIWSNSHHSITKKELIDKIKAYVKKELLYLKQGEVAIKKLSKYIIDG